MERSPDVVLPCKRLGKQPRRIDTRTLRLANYVKKAALPKPRPSADWSKKTRSWPMLMNDVVGDCTIVSTLHMQQAWIDNRLNKSASDRVSFTVNDAEALQAYEKICGYDPANPDATDQGGVELDVLSAWRSDGIGGHKIAAYAAVTRSMQNLVKLALDWFGGLYIGLSLPLSAQDQKTWDVTDGADAAEGSWGGHAVNLVAYDAKSLTCITWGDKQKMTWAWWQRYCDECYACISQDWLDARGKTPRGLDLKALTDDLKLVTG